jgi:predicted ATP-dependent Lon-type protease
MIEQTRGTITPQYRFALKAEIIKSGYRTLSEFANAIDSDIARLSRVIKGWEIPGPSLQNAITQRLGLTLDELAELL